MPTPFHTSRFVEFSDTDMAGIMHFSAYFRFMEAAEHQLIRKLGFSVYTELDGDVVVCPRHGARFSLRTGDALTPPAYEPVRTYATRVADGMVEVQAV